MSKRMNWKLATTLALAVAFMLTTGGLVVGSNMGFKINKAILGPATAGTFKGLNLISLPFNNPYPTAKPLCTALGLTLFSQSVQQVNPVSGLTSNCPTGCDAGTPAEVGFSFACSGAAPGPTTLGQKGVQVTLGAGATVNRVLVGSSIEAGAGAAWGTIYSGFQTSKFPKCQNYVSVPYHTTWVTAQDVCASLGIGALAGNVLRINPDPTVGTQISHPCGNTTTNNFALVIGEGLIVRKNQNAVVCGGAGATNIVGFIPPRF